jgi:hypothetical protein
VLPKSKKNIGQKNNRPFLIFKPYIFFIFKRNILSDYKIMGITIEVLQKINKTLETMEQCPMMAKIQITNYFTTSITKH